MSLWYYLDVSDEIGPITFDQLQTKILCGDIKRDTLVRLQNSSWDSAADVRELTAFFPSPPVPTSYLDVLPPARNQIIEADHYYSSHPLAYVIVGVIAMFWLGITASMGGLMFLIAWAAAFIGAFCCAIVAILQKKDPVMSAMIGVLLGPIIGLFAVLLSAPKDR